MSDEAKAALEQRLDWCEAQLRNVRKRMFSMGILIALLAVLLIWRTKAPGDLVRTGDTARFESIELVDEQGRSAVLDGRSLTFTGLEEERSDVTGRTDIGPGFVGVTGAGGSLVLDGRKEGYGVRMQNAAGTTEHLRPR